jgi:hypothetical protein
VDGVARGVPRVWSWAASDVEADARRHDAEELVGERIRGIRYYTIDYRRHELHPELIDAGPRIVDAESEVWRAFGDGPISSLLVTFEILIME